MRLLGPPLGVALLALGACGHAGGPAAEAPEPDGVEVPPGPAARAPAYGAIPEDICAGIHNTYECAQAKEAYQLKRAPATVSRSGNVLTLRLPDGQAVRIRDRPAREPDVADVVLYSYLGIHRGVGRHLLEVQYYEGGAYLLVHPVTGHRTRIAALPVVAPSGDRFAVVTSAYDYASASSLQIWRISDPLRREWEAELPGWRASRHAATPPPWAPRSATWTGPSALRVTLEARSSAFETRAAGAVTVERSPAGWSFRRDPGEVVQEALEAGNDDDAGEASRET